MANKKESTCDEVIENEFQQHYCAFQPTGVVIVYDNLLDRDHKTWRLEGFRQVTERDLEENHYFETLEDVVWRTAVEIRCCPYCGAELAEQKPPQGWQAKMMHLDYSGWKVKQG